MKGLQLVVQHHGHEQHQHVHAFDLYGWRDETGTGRVGELEDDFIAFNVVQHFIEIRAFEADAHGFALIVAQNFFVSRHGEVDVL